VRTSVAESGGVGAGVAETSSVRVVVVGTCTDTKSCSSVASCGLHVSIARIEWPKTKRYLENRSRETHVSVSTDTLSGTVSWWASEAGRGGVLTTGKGVETGTSTTVVVVVTETGAVGWGRVGVVVLVAHTDCVLDLLHETWLVVVTVCGAVGAVGGGGGGLTEVGSSSGLGAETVVVTSETGAVTASASEARVVWVVTGQASAVVTGKAGTVVVTGKTSVVASCTEAMVVSSTRVVLTGETTSGASGVWEVLSAVSAGFSTVLVSFD
jgi:hypothetical protein